MKKQYITPVLKVATLNFEGLIATSIPKADINISDETTKDDALMNNRLEHNWQHTWE